MAAVQKKNIIVNDYRSHPSALARQIQRGMQSVAAFPIMREDLLLGILTITSKQRDHFTPDRVRLLAAVTHELSTLLENTRLEEEVTIQRELEDRQKKFISIASHELRTPMAVISGYTELLIERDLPAATLKESLKRIYRNTRALTKLVDDLLNVTRIQSGSITISPEPSIFRDIVEEVLASIRLDYDGSDFQIDTPPGLPLIYADRSKLAQVMANLLENAVKYSPPGGRVTVSATYNPERDCVIVAVADQGIGISPEDQASLFTTFHRILRPETEGVRGSGLGLYIVKELVGLMEGQVWVESELGRGSTFYVAMPASLPKDGFSSNGQARPLQRRLM